MEEEWGSDGWLSVEWGKWGMERGGWWLVGMGGKLGSGKEGVVRVGSTPARPREISLSSYFEMEPWNVCVCVCGWRFEGCYCGVGSVSQPVIRPSTDTPKCISHVTTTTTIPPPTSLLSLERPTSSTSTDGLSYGTPQRNPKGPTSTKRVLAYTCICTHS